MCGECQQIVALLDFLLQSLDLVNAVHGNWC
jgi:hypothetical protein